MYKAEITVCDKKIETLLKQKKVDEDPHLELSSLPQLQSGKKKQNKLSPTFNVRQLAFAHLKTDLFQIPGVSHTTVLAFLCNMGKDIRRFKTAKQFASWLRLVPNNKISGGKIVSSGTPKRKNTIAGCLRQAANSIGNQSNHPLTPFFKRVAYRKGRGAAITATARKLAVIIWNMLIKSQSYTGYDYDTINQKRRNTQLKNIRGRLAKMTCQICNSNDANTREPGV